MIDAQGKLRAMKLGVRPAKVGVLASDATHRQCSPSALRAVGG